MKIMLIAATSALALSWGSAAHAAAKPAAAAPAAVTATVASVPGKPTIVLGDYDFGALGFTVQEFFIDGTATSYASATPLSSDGNWTVKPAATAAYRTRMVVIRPKDPAKFNGTALVEWLNVSGGLDAPAEWLMAHREILRSGYAFIGVSAQKVGIDGGRSMGADMSLKKVNPARYGSLVHPGDAFAFDIFSQAGRLVRANTGGILGSLELRRVIAAGESQSASFLTTYINAVDPLAKAYDGFLVHSRFASSAPLDGASLLAQTGAPASMPQSVRFRSTPRVPVMVFETETDVLGAGRPGYAMSRQPETANLSVWEVPGTAHADLYTAQGTYADNGTLPLAKLAAAMTPSVSLMGTTLSAPFNFSLAHHYGVEAALAALNNWVRTGKPVASSPKIDLTGESPMAAKRDANGLATGGARTPWIDIPIARNTGLPRGENPFARIFGSGDMFDAATLTAMYPGGKAEYLKKFTARLDATITAGYILAADRAEILSLASASYPADGQP